MIEMNPIYNSERVISSRFSKIKTHLIWSSINTLCSIITIYRLYFLNCVLLSFIAILYFCSLFFSVTALVYSFKVTEDIKSGFFRKAVRHSTISYKLNFNSTLITIIVWLISIFLLIYVIYIQQISTSDVVLFVRNLSAVKLFVKFLF